MNQTTETGSSDSFPILPFSPRRVAQVEDKRRILIIMHTPARELLQRTDVEEGSVEVRFGPLRSYPAMRALAQRFGRLFGHIIRLNIRYLYPDQLRELLGEFLIAFLSSLRREPEVSNLDFIDTI